MALRSVKTKYVWGVSIHWTGLLDWNTGLDYWTELFSFFGQVSALIFRKEPTFLQSTSTWLLWMIIIMTIVVYYSVFSSK